MVSQRLFDISIGILLGDASIQKNRSKSVEKWRLKILQGEVHRHYVESLHREFTDYVRVESPPPVYFDSGRKTYSFLSLFTPDFGPLASIFLNSKGEKHVGGHFLENTLSPLSWAHWLMDHGGGLRDYPRRAIVSNCHAFPENECEILRDNLNRGYNLESWCKRNRGKTIVAIPAGKWGEFRDLVPPHVL